MHTMWCYSCIPEDHKTVLHACNTGAPPLFTTGSVSFHVFFFSGGENIYLSTVLFPATKLLYFVNCFSRFSVWLVMGVPGLSKDPFSDSTWAQRVRMVGHPSAFFISSNLGPNLIYPPPLWLQWISSFFQSPRRDLKMKYVYEIFPQADR